MFQNLKVDIVYYKTNTDFEMEFNLCGCCRMRLLTDKPSDQKTFLHSLARAVSRSSIIIITGNLFGEDGIINIAAGATGAGLQTADNKSFGIKGEEEISIIKNSTPLVTPDGYFGGCIIESGPQTMILLSENKSIRKTLMQTLIHPYIEEVCAEDLKEKAAAVNTVIDNIEEETVDEQETEIVDEELQDSETETQDTEQFSETEETKTDENIILDNNSVTDIDDSTEETEENALADNQIILTDGMVYESDDDEDIIEYEEDIRGLYTEASKMSRRDADKYNASYINFESHDQGFVADNDAEFFTFKTSLNLPILIISVLLLIVLAVLCYCIFYVPSKDGVAAATYVREIFGTLFG